MRQQQNSDWQLFLQPVWVVTHFLLRQLQWWLLLLAITYLGSGLTMVQSDEIALVYRFGQLQGDGAQAIHHPGFLLAFPKPIDQVLRIPVQKVFEQDIDALHFRSSTQKTFFATATLDPETVGYALTGDGNVVHVSFSLKYQVSDPIIFANQIADVSTVLDHSLRSIAIQEIAQRSVDSILSDGRESLVKAISNHCQQHWNQLALGIKIVSLEIVDLVPPYQVKDDFSAVQTADIEAQTKIQKAQQYRAEQLPKAQTDYNTAISEAKSAAQKTLSDARAHSNVFLQLVQEAKEEPRVLRRRLLQEGLEKTVKNAGQLQFVPPPVGRQYTDGFHIVVKMDQK